MGRPRFLGVEICQRQWPPCPADDRDMILVHLLKQPRFTWGSGNLVDAGECRKQYVQSLRAADRYNYEPLLAFVRS